MRCKQCGRVFQVPAGDPVAQPAGPAPTAAVPARKAEPPWWQQAQPAPVAAVPVAGPPPMRAIPVAAPSAPAYAPYDPDGPVGGHRARHRRIRNSMRLVVAGFCLLVLAVAARKVDWPHLVSQVQVTLTPPPEEASATAARDDPPAPPILRPPAGSPTRPRDVPSSADFPRRILAISVNNYLYANPINYGGQGWTRDGRTHVIVDSLARYLHVHPNQTVLLSDGAPSARPPLKSVIENTVQDFLDTSRAQDRIVLLFVGHAIEIEDQPYLVPLEGELEDKEQLIPLAWLYDRLARCKARQKVLMLDVCRFDPTRGQERPDSGPMGEKLDAALKAPPAGVQVLSTCVAGQYSYEFDNGVIMGGVALHQIPRLTLMGRPEQRPEDALPLARLVEALGNLTRADVKVYQKAEQTVRLTGQEPGTGAAYDPKEPMPPTLVVKVPPLLEGGTASEAEVKSILDQLDVPPPKKSREDAVRLRIESTPRFSAKALAPYRPDMDTPLKQAVLKAVAVLRDPKVSRAFPDEFPVPNGDEARFKQQIIDIQKSPDGPGRAQLVLSEALDHLTEAGKLRDEDASKRWQANYDYILARLLARIAYVHEHNYMLGQMRKELPPRDPTVHKGWRLASQEKLQSGKDARDLAKRAQDLLKRLAEEHPGTPWALLGKRERVTTLGLRWEPTSLELARK